MAVHFTKQQIDEIEQALTARSKKDSQFPGADLLEGTELIPIVQNGVNKVMTYSGLWNKVAADLREYVEESLDSKVDKEEGKELSANDFTDALLDKLNHIQAGAEVNVQSDWEAESGDAFILHKPDLSVYATVASVEDIEALIPSTASESNKLADKAFVNSSISTNTAEFKGTYDTLAELMTVAANLNDYGFVRGVDQLGNITFDRYKYTSSDTWLYEYTLNNTSFTAAQWAAINSGITESLVSKLDALPTNDSLTALLGGKVDKVSGKQLSTEDYTTAEKTKLGDLPTNGALNTALAGKVDKVEGKALSTNDYTTAEKNKLAGLEYIVDAKTEVKTDQEFIYRKTNVSWDATTEILQSIKGKTLAWNQLVTNGNFVNLVGWNYPGGRVSVADKIVTINFDAQYSSLYRIINVISGHKYYISLEAKPTQTSDLFFRYGIGGVGYFSDEGVMFSLSANSISSTTAFTRLSTIGTFTKLSSDTSVSGIYLMKFGGAAQDVQVKNLMVFDLTIMFGAGNEPSTVEEFEALFHLPYHAYNPGALISNNAESLETVGFNKWDEEWEFGSISPGTGTNINSSDQIRTIGKIHVYPNTDYYFKLHVVGGGSCLYLYDAQENYIGYIDVESNVSGKQFTVPSNAYYLRFVALYDDATTYNHDICINISDPSRNGQYEPYKKSVCPLNIKTRTGKLNGQGASVVVFPNGMNGVGTSFDEANRTKVTKRRARVDLGTLGWEKADPYGLGKFSYVAVISDAKRYTYHPAICSKYDVIDSILTEQGVATGLSLNNNNACRVYDPAFDNAGATAAEFKEAMNGVMLDYEIAEPQEFVWDEPIANLIPTDRLGTERAIYPESDTPSAPFIADIQYGATTRDLVEAFKDRFEMLWNAVFNYPESE